MSDTRPIFLDHHSTTPCDPRVVDAMRPYLSVEFGNASSRTHRFGWNAAEALEEARARVAAAIGASAREIVFTSGATESNNLAILGVVRAARRQGLDSHVVTCQTEHRAVLDPCAAIRSEGARVTLLAVDERGRLDPARVARALEPSTRLVSLMHANNEIGVLHDLAGVSRVLREHGALLHSDAAQSLGKIPVDVAEIGVDLLSLTAHKLYGPKGIGALFVKRASPPLRLEPLIYGGGHERGLRSGTVPVALAVGFGVACEIARASLARDAQHVASLRDRLWELLRGQLSGLRRNGCDQSTLPGNLNVTFQAVDGEALLASLPDLAASSGSACTSAKPEPSHVLRALGRSAAEAHSSIRFGVGRDNTVAEIDAAAARLVVEVKRLRALSATWRPGERSRT